MDDDDADLPVDEEEAVAPAHKGKAASPRLLGLGASQPASDEHDAECAEPSRSAQAQPKPAVPVQPMQTSSADAQHHDDEDVTRDSDRPQIQQEKAGMCACCTIQ